MCAPLKQKNIQWINQHQLLSPARHRNQAILPPATAAIAPGRKAIRTWIIIRIRIATRDRIAIRRRAASRLGNPAPREAAIPRHKASVGINRLGQKAKKLWKKIRLSQLAKLTRWTIIFYQKERSFVGDERSFCQPRIIPRMTLTIKLQKAPPYGGAFANYPTKFIRKDHIAKNGRNDHSLRWCSIIAILAHGNIVQATPFKNIKHKRLLGLNNVWIL